MQGVFKCEDVKGIEVPPPPQTVCKLETNAHNEQSDRNVRGWGVGGLIFCPWMKWSRRFTAVEINQ